MLTGIFAFANTWTASQVPASCRPESALRPQSGGCGGSAFLPGIGQGKLGISSALGRGKRPGAKASTPTFRRVGRIANCGLKSGDGQLVTVASWRDSYETIPASHLAAACYSSALAF